MYNQRKYCILIGPIKAEQDGQYRKKPPNFNPDISYRYVKNAKVSRRKFCWRCELTPHHRDKSTFFLYIFTIILTFNQFYYCSSNAKRYQHMLVSTTKKEN